MKRALTENWALFLGMLMLMAANGLLVVLLTLRGAELGFSGLTIALMQGCYPAGALIGTAIMPKLIERVGHIRAFSAMASTVSAAAIVHLLSSDAMTWAAMRLVAGACFPGLYVITESWLNAKAENHNRAQILSLYFMIQSAGPAIGIFMAGLPDPSGNLWFGIASILLSVAIVPLLLSANRAPDYTAPDRMTMARLNRISPVTIFGIAVMGAGVAGWFIAVPLFALELGLSQAQASSLLVACMIAGGVSQYPIGWVSDRVDRRDVVIALAVLSALAALWLAADVNPARAYIGFVVIAAATLPIYSILAAHANDRLAASQIVPASGTMAFTLQLGQMIGMVVAPNVVGLAGLRGLPLTVAAVGVVVALYTVARRVRRAAPTETGEFVATGVIGITSPGGFQAEMISEAQAEEPQSQRNQARSIDRQP